MLSTMLRRKLVCVLILGFLPVLSFAAISCMDMNGRPVDWFIVYKLPEINDRNPSIQNGTAFMYMDVNEQNFRLSDVSLDNEKQAVGYTLEQIYRSQTIGYGMYNDQHPDGKVVSNRAHTKGKLLQYYWPSTYDSRILSFNGLRSLVAALEGQHTTNQVDASSLTTRNGQEFLNFAKSNTFNKDLYSDWVAPGLESDLFTETWQSGAGGKLPSSCNTKFHVMNVQSVCIKGVSFLQTKDHSKWAVSTNSNNPWTCIGDINRQDSQKNRGGGTVCFSLPDVWKAYYSVIQQYEECPTRSPRAILAVNQSDPLSCSFTGRADSQTPRGYLFLSSFIVALMVYV